MNKIFILIIVIISIPLLVYSQSKTELDRERKLYKDNKVKTEIISSTDGSKSIRKYDKSGKIIEIKGYYNNVEASIVNYKYDINGNMTEESYYGYESGDGISTFFFYDLSGNIVKKKSVGSDNIEEFYKYDVQGNIIQTKYGNDDSPNEPPYYIEYDNVYENGKLNTKENLCNQQTQDITQTKYTYASNNIILIEEFEKNCTTGLVKFYSKKTLDYFDNGLIKETTFESVYTEGTQKDVYSYEFYTN